MPNDRPLRILITNNSLSTRGGSETYVRDLASGLIQLGHHPIVFSPILGEAAEDLKAATIPVIDDPASLNVPPDIIHGHHHLETMRAAGWFSETPAIYLCQGWAPWEETPPVFPTIRRYVAISDFLKERLLATPLLPPSHVRVIYSFTDRDRFRLSGTRPARPRSALFFKRDADQRAIDVLREASLACGIERFHVAGQTPDDWSRPEDLLGNYDIVFALGRSALEAMASGCAVIVTDGRGTAGLATRDSIPRLHALNCGARAIQVAEATAEGLAGSIRAYDAVEAQAVARWVRENASAKQAVARWVELYGEVLEEWRDPDVRSRATDRMVQGADWSRYVALVSPLIKERFAMIRHQLDAASDEASDLRSELSASKAAADRWKTAADEASATADQYRERLEQSVAALTSTASELAAIRNSRSWALARRVSAAAHRLRITRR